VKTAQPVRRLLRLKAIPQAGQCDIPNDKSMANINASGVRRVLPWRTMGMGSRGPQRTGICTLQGPGG